MLTNASVLSAADGADVDVARLHQQVGYAGAAVADVGFQLAEHARLCRVRRHVQETQQALRWGREVERAPLAVERERDVVGIGNLHELGYVSALKIG